MEKYNKSVGKMGEAHAVYYLKKKSFRILERNYTIRGGEIDIIAKYGDWTVFIEVKTRTNDRFGSGLEKINYYKQEYIKRTALHYLKGNPYGKIRFDVIEIVGEIKNNRLLVNEVNHIENAF